jgi:hypothetical protein
MVANKFMLRAMGLFQSFMGELVEMHYLLSDPILMNDDRLNSVLGGIERTSYDEGIRKTLETLARD